MNRKRLRNWQSDSLVRAIIGVWAFLGLLTLISVATLRAREIGVQLAWFVTTEAFILLSAWALAALCYGRYRASDGPWTFWTGLGFLANGTVVLFFLLTWPDLLAGRAIIGQSPNIPAWLWLLKQSSLLLIVIGGLVNWPARLEAPSLAATYAGVLVLAVIFGVLSVLFEEALPVAIVATTFTPVTLVWQSGLIALFVLGAVVTTRRYLLEDDRFLAYLALFLVIMSFGFLIALLGGARYSLLWYASRLFYVLAYVVVLFGLLQERYVVYRAERLRVERLAALNEVSLALGTTTDLPEVGRKAVEVAARTMEADSAVLYVYEEETNLMSLVASFGLGRDFVDRFGSMPVDARSGVAQTVMAGRPWLSDVGPLSPSDLEPMKAAGATAFAAVPVRARGRSVGVLGVGRRMPNAFAATDVELLRSIADQIGVAGENARLYEQMRSINEQLATASIRAQELAENAERRSDELNALIESIAEGVVIVDGEGRVLRINRAAKDIWGLRAGESIPTTLAQLLEFDLRYPGGRPLSINERPIVKALRGEIFTQQEVLYVKPDGSQVNLLAAGSAVRDEQGKVILAVVVFRDITQIRELERQREEFISVVAHDLRGTLTVIKGFASYLMRPSIKQVLPDQAQRALDEIISSTRRMERMISDLLDVSRIEARRLTLMKRPIDVPSLVRDIVQRSEDLLIGHPVKVEVRGRIPEVNADPDRLEQVLSNLLSNAGKYSYPDSEITVEIEPRPGEVMISLTNLGPGVLPEDKEKIFTRFHRTKQAQAERVPGLGLGLYIAKGLVEAHGGRIWVESEPGEYATFRFTLPEAP